MRRAPFGRPILHSIGHCVCNAFVQALSVFDRLAQRAVNLLWQTLAHGLVAEHHAPEQIRNTVQIAIMIVIHYISASLT